MRRDEVTSEERGSRGCMHRDEATKRVEMSTRNSPLGVRSIIFCVPIPANVVRDNFFLISIPVGELISTGILRPRLGLSILTNLIID